MEERAGDHADTAGHRAPNMDDGMEMIRHHAELQDTYLREMFMEMEEALYQVFGKRGLGHVGFGGVLLGDLELAKNRAPTCCGKRHVIDADAFPSRAGFLPVPVVIHLRQNLAQRYKKNRIYANFRGEK